MNKNQNSDEVNSRHHQVAHQSDDVIAITYTADLPPFFERPLNSAIEKIFGYKVCFISILKDLNFAYDSKRNQYHSTRILEKLSEQAPANALKILAITDKDLFIPILTYVYGEAQLGGKACIISIHRLKKGISALDPEDIFLQRVIKEAVHEIGHTFKLKHCKDVGCIMHYCRNEHDVDLKTDQLCRYCKILVNDEIKRLQIISQ